LADVYLKTQRRQIQLERHMLKACEERLAAITSALAVISNLDELAAQQLALADKHLAALQDTRPILSDESAAQNHV
jgi:hypothetical protein